MWWAKNNTTAGDSKNNYSVSNTTGTSFNIPTPKDYSKILDNLYGNADVCKTTTVSQSSKTTVKALSKEAEVLTEKANKFWCALHKVFGEEKFLPGYIYSDDYRDVFSEYTGFSYQASSFYVAVPELFVNLISRGLILSEEKNGRDYFVLNTEREEEVKSSVFLDKI